MANPILHTIRANEADYVVGGGAVNVVDLTACTYRLTAKVPAARILGTSAGSYTSACIAMGVLPEKALKAYHKILPKNRALDGGLWNLARNFGWARGDALRDTAFSLVGDITLGETKIPFGCYVADTWAPEAGPMLLSSWTTPDVLLVDAVVASGAIPLGIQPQKVRGLGRGNRLFGDGGTGRNFPLDAFDDIAERPTIGIRVKPDAPDPVTNAVRAGDWKAFIRSLFAQMMWASNNAHNTSKCRALIVDVACPGDSLDFDQSPDQIDARWQNGSAAGEAHVAKALRLVRNEECVER